MFSRTRCDFPRLVIAALDRVLELCPFAGIALFEGFSGVRLHDGPFPILVALVARELPAILVSGLVLLVWLAGLGKGPDP